MMNHSGDGKADQDGGKDHLSEVKRKSRSGSGVNTL
jgi:hypothetical protein